MSAVNIYQILHVRRSLGSLVLCNQLSPSTEVTLVIYRAGPHCQQGSADLLNDTKKKKKNRMFARFWGGQRPSACYTSVTQGQQQAANRDTDEKISNVFSNEQ